MPQRPVVTNSFVVRLHSVRVEQLGLMAVTKVPIETHRRHGQIGPAVADGQRAEVDIADPSTRCRCANVDGSLRQAVVTFAARLRSNARSMPRISSDRETVPRSASVKKQE